MLSLSATSVICLFLVTIAAVSSANDAKELRNIPRVDSCAHGGVIRNVSAIMTDFDGFLISILIKML